jgi:MraZ protein
LTFGGERCLIVSKNVNKGINVMSESGTDMNNLTVKGCFTSDYKHSLDPKKRLTIPSEWREHIGESKDVFILPNTKQGCLRVFRGQEMDARLSKLLNVKLSDAEMNNYARVIAENSQRTTWDSQGRIRIKDKLLDLADLTSDVIFVGTLNCFELWNPDALAKLKTEKAPSLEDALENLGI